MIFQGKRLQVGVEIGPQPQKSAQADLDEDVVSQPIDHAPEKLDEDKSEAKEADDLSDRKCARSGPEDRAQKM
jgi:hypothetical protein